MTETDDGPDPVAPPGLSARGDEFWRQTVAEFDLSDSEWLLVGEVCRVLDECELLRQALDDDGIMVEGSTGQRRVNPAVGELRQHRLALAKLLGQLGLPDEDGETLLTPGQVRAQKAAQARWAAQTNGRARLAAVTDGTA
jgi:hypothetical protein